MGGGAVGLTTGRGGSVSGSSIYSGTSVICSGGRVTGCGGGRG